jgi:hypothetical protein
MSRSITAERRQQIANARIADPNALGPMLGELVVEGHVPVEAVAQLLSVSDVTIYRWMYGTASPRDADKIVKIKRLLSILRKARRAKDLPLVGNVKTRIIETGRIVREHMPQSHSRG